MCFSGRKIFHRVPRMMNERKCCRERILQVLCFILWFNYSRFFTNECSKLMVNYWAQLVMVVQFEHFCKAQLSASMLIFYKTAFCRYRVSIIELQLMKLISDYLSPFRSQYRGADDILNGRKFYVSIPSNLQNVHQTMRVFGRRRYSITVETTAL